MQKIDVHVHVPGVMKQTGCPISEIGSHRDWVVFKKLQNMLEHLDQPDLLRNMTLKVVGKTKKVDSCVLLAMDHIYSVDDDGNAQKHESDSELYTSNDYVLECVSLVREHFGKTAYLGASIHPARPDAIDELNRAYKNGAVLIKWIPSVQNIELQRYDKIPQVKEKVDAFYKRMAELGIPLLCHTGREHTIPPAFHDDSKQNLNDPAALEHLFAIESGGRKLKVIAAHCALPIHGDPEIRADGMTPWLDTFLELFEKYDNLYGDVAAYFLASPDCRLPEDIEIIRKLSLLPEYSDRILLGGDLPSLPNLLSSIDPDAPDLQKCLDGLWEVNPIDQNMDCFNNNGFNEKIFTNAEKVLRLPDQELWFNCHAHISGFKSIMSKGSLEILMDRFKREIGKGRLSGQSQEWLDDFQKVLSDELQNLTEGKEVSTERLFEKWLKTNESQAKDALSRFVNRTRPYDSDVYSEDAFDFMEFLRLGFAEIEDNADELLKNLGDDAIAINLTLDFASPGESDSTDKNFARQLDKTVDAVLKYPGRILPFYAVNPHRSNWLERMRTVFGEQAEYEDYGKYAGAFLGIKLYPSSGYTLDELGMPFFQFCIEHDIPVIMHCNRGGFSQADALDNCSPAALLKWLGDDNYKKLRICFAHFGGDEGLCADPVTDGDGYTAQVIELLKNPAYPNVFADLSYHDASMHGGREEVNYFSNLKMLLGQSQIQDRILFGTDFYLIRQRATDKNYVSYFREQLGRDNFTKVALANPVSFLEFPVDGKIEECPEVFSRHVLYLKRARDTGSLKGTPPAWLEKMLLQAGASTEKK